MSEEILIHHTPYETQVYGVNNGVLQEVHISTSDDKAMVGNVYWGRVVRVLTGMQAAFVDIGLERTAFLHVSDLCWTDDQSVPPCISTQLKAEDRLAVQIIKPPIGSKGARLSAQLSFAARYLVFMPSLDHNALSSRIEDEEARVRLLTWLNDLSESGGFIARTASECVSHSVLINNQRYLEQCWKEVQQLIAAPDLKVGTLLYEELPLVRRVLRDWVTETTQRILVDDTEAFESLKKFCQRAMPEFLTKIQLHTGKKPLFDLYHVEEDMKKALSRQITLKSGGFLVFDQTEAMTTIDINTGAFVGKKNVDDTLFKTNLEAAQVIARQLRLRNIGGIIIIDFIDMNKAEHRQQVRDMLIQSLSDEPVKMYVSEFSELGLIQMTRKRTRPSLEQVFSDICQVCSGRGKVRSVKTICSDILKEIMRSFSQYSALNYLVLACQDVVDRFMQEEAEQVLWLEDRLRVNIRFQIEASYQQENFDVILL